MGLFSEALSFPSPLQSSVLSERSLIDDANCTSLYVAFPHIAQGQLQRASLDLISEEVADPQADSVQLTLTTQANNPSPYHPKLDAFNVSLFLEDTLPDIKPFGYITIPSITAAKHVNITVSQRLNIVDMDQFNKYTLTTLQADTYRVALQGKTKLREMKFPATEVQFNKVITTQGTYISSL